MEIDRRDFDSAGKARHRVTFCLNKLEKASMFKHGLDMESEIVSGLTLEEILGALVAAEIDLET